MEETGPSLIKWLVSLEKELNLTLHTAGHCTPGEINSLRTDGDFRRQGRDTEIAQNTKFVETHRHNHSLESSQVAHSDGTISLFIHYPRKNALDFLTSCIFPLSQLTTKRAYNITPQLQTSAFLPSYLSPWNEKKKIIKRL
jgi:hypothetical protein